MTQLLSNERTILSTRQHWSVVLPALVLIIGGIVGLAVVAFILLTDNLGAKLYPAEGPGWCRRRRLTCWFKSHQATGRSRRL